MRQFIRAAAIAVALFLMPAAGPAGSPQASEAMPVPVRIAPESPFGIARGHEHDRVSALAPGQTPADFEVWLEEAPANRASLLAFRERLEADGVEDVVPLWQLVRTSSSWRECGAEPFEVAPAADWAHIVATLKFVRDEVVPAIGPVEALSGYRDEALNACSDGAPLSAHRLFFAIDLTPLRPEVSRAAMIRDICSAHAREGAAYHAGLGFYSGRRFHVDTNGYRKWGPDGSGATSPCVTGIV